MLKKTMMLGVVFVLALFFGLTSHGYAEEKGPIAYWKFDEGKGRIVKDISGNKNNGRIYGAARTEGKLGKALIFDGVNDSVIIPAHGSLDTQTFTIEMWINPAYKRSESDGFFYSAPAVLRFFLVKSNHRVRVRWKKADAKYKYYYLTKTAVPQNEWSHLVFTYDNATDILTGYRNGKLEIVNTKVGGIFDKFGGPIRIGWARNIGNYFKGAIGEVGIYNRVLSAEEIKKNDLGKVKMPNISRKPMPTVLTFDINARNSGDFVLIKDRKPAAQFVVTKNQQKATGTTKGFGISESIKDFNEDLKECTNGVGLPMTGKDGGKTRVIRFSLESRSLPDEDRFSITFPDSRTMLITGTSISIHWALNHILEEFAGVRYLARSKNGAHLPQIATLVLPGRKIEIAPSFNLNRQFYYGDCKYLYKHKRAYNKAGLRFNHDLSCQAFPVKKYMKEKKWPEFIFPIRNGKKFLPYLPYANPRFKKSWQYRVGWQPCMTNQETVDEAVKNICEYFDKHQDKISVSLGVNDCGVFCGCKGCSKLGGKKRTVTGHLDYSELYYAWINKIVEAVVKKHPDKYFGCLAYREVINPPSFKLHKNIVPFITFESFACMDKDVKATRINLLKDWSKKASNSGWWEYSMNRAYNLPKVAFDVQQNMLKTAYENNVRAVFMEAEGAIEDGPARYLFRKLMWDVNMDREALQQDWYEKFTCKQAAPYLAEYYKWWGKFWRKKAIKSEWFQSSKKNTYLNTANMSYIYYVERGDMEKMRGLMEKVVELTSKYGDKRQKIRAKWLMREFEYSEACVYALGADIFSPGGISKKNVNKACEYLNNISKAVKYDARRVKLRKERADDPDFGRSYKSKAGAGNYVVTTVSKIANIAQEPEVRKAFAKIAKNNAVPAEISGLLNVFAKLENNEPVKNLQPNGSFENGNCNSSNKGKVTTEKACHGKYSMKLNLNTGKHWIVPKNHAKYIKINKKPGLYLMSFMVYIEQDNPDVEEYVQMYASAQKKAGGISYNAWQTPKISVTPGKWTRISLITNIPPNRETVCIVMCFANYQDATAYIDDIIVTPLEAK